MKEDYVVKTFLESLVYSEVEHLIVGERAAAFYRGRSAQTDVIEVFISNTQANMDRLVDAFATFDPYGSDGRDDVEMAPLERPIAYEKWGCHFCITPEMNGLNFDQCYARRTFLPESTLTSGRRLPVIHLDDLIRHYEFSLGHEALATGSEDRFGNTTLTMDLHTLRELKTVQKRQREKSLER